MERYPNLFGSDNESMAELLREIVRKRDNDVSEFSGLASTPSYTPNTAIDSSSATDSTAANIPYDDTIPQNTEGKEFTNVTITPTSVSSKVRGVVTAHVGANTNNTLVILAIFADSGVNAIASAVTRITDSNDVETVCFTFEHVPATTSPVTYRLRFGGHANTAYINRQQAGRVLGGTFFTSITVSEIV